MESAIAKRPASRNVRFGWLVLSGLAAAGLAGCSGADEPTASSEGSGAAVSDEAELASRGACPSDPLEAVGKACNDDLVCTYRVSCAEVDQQATCRCRDGALACEDALGALASGELPRCLRMEHAVPAECPETLPQASASACDVVGSACFYAGKTCEGRSAQHLDRCLCEADGDGRLRFTCEVGECLPLSD